MVTKIFINHSRVPKQRVKTPEKIKAKPLKAHQLLAPTRKLEVKQRRSHGPR